MPDAAAVRTHGPPPGSPARAPGAPGGAAGRERVRLPWPLPALIGWALGWLGWVALQALALNPASAFVGATALGALPAWTERRTWRRLMVTGGFPLSLLLMGGAGTLPAWIWLLPLAALLLLYPVRAWRDAPVFPTDAGALAGLDERVTLAPGARIVDAGSGLGHGLRALRGLWPAARIEGVERSALLAAWSRWRCPWARVTRADMWAASWRGVDLVYLFQRPESMPRAWDKARAELAPGAWLVSLEFEIPGVAAVARLQRPGRRPVHVYRVGREAAAAQPTRAAADNPPRACLPRASA